MKAEPVKFTLGDNPQVYVLEYDFNGICKAEEQSGLNLFKPQEEPSSQYVRAILQGYLLKAHPLVTLAEAGELLSRDRDKVLEALGKAMAGPTDSEAQTDPEEPPAEK